MDSCIKPNDKDHFFIVNKVFLYIFQDTRNVMASTKMFLIGLACGEQRDSAAHIYGYVDEVVPRYTDRQFRDHFRMCRGTFEVCTGVH